jgi:amidase
MRTELHFLELLELADCLRRREVTSVEATRSQLDRIATLDPHLNSYVFVMAEDAMAAAAQADREIATGHYRGPLHGVPVGVKDLFWTQNAPTAAGMAIYRDFYPRQDATAVTRMKDAGAVILGKLQMTEGAYSDYHPSIRPPINPWDESYWTGISSSGPAVATAAGICYGALASDTGGSIRWPCAANGLTGIKPTWGRVSRFGAFELAASLDHVGVMARSAADVGALLGAIAGSDPKDPTALSDFVPDYLASSDVRGLRIGIDPRLNADDVDSPVRRALANAAETFRALGAMLIEVTAPDVGQSVMDWTPACAVEASIAHEKTYPARKSEYGPVLASVLEAGRGASATEQQEILLRRMDLRACFATLFQSVDLILAPVQPFAPLSLSTIRTLGVQPDLIFKLQRFTAPFDMTGNPTLTLPGGFSDEGLPIGFQLIADHLSESKLVRAGRAFQHRTNWHRQHPLN